MKKKEVLIFLGLVVATIALSEWLAAKFISRPAEIHLESAYRVDSINTVEYERIARTYQHIAEEVISKGMRNDDLMVMIKVKSIMESFRTPLQNITGVQNILSNEIEGERITSSERDSIE